MSAGGIGGFRADTPGGMRVLGPGPGEPLHISFFGTDWFSDICQEYRSFNRYEPPFLFSWQLTNYSQYLHLAKYTTRFMNQQKL